MSIPLIATLAAGTAPHAIVSIRPRDFRAIVEIAQVVDKIKFSPPEQQRLTAAEQRKTAVISAINLQLTAGVSAIKMQLTAVAVRGGGRDAHGRCM